ncbi:MAG: hypothetical protein Q9227_003057 [Pyrenula ochraceoflavens]
MARLAQRSPSPDEDSGEEEITAPSNHGQPSSSTDHLSSPPPSSSDKENRTSSSRPQSSRAGKRKSDAAVNVSASAQRVSDSAKRRKTNDTTAPACYDPDQDQDERRHIRKGLRDLSTMLNESAAEYIQPNSTGLKQTLEQANQWFREVRNTSDATIDSRLLLNTGDLSLKKVQQLNLGDANVGIDTVEFITKCASFMRQSPNSGSQRNRDDDDEDEEEGDSFDWDYLGRTICFAHNARPSLSSHLLGPLSVQKKVRQVSQKRTQHEKIDRNAAIRPIELNEEDLEKQETANLTQVCKAIEKQLIKIRVDGEYACEREITDAMTDQEALDVMSKHNLSDDGGVPLLKFCVDPLSYSNSVENLFHISFLLKEGSLGLSMDSLGFPTLHPGQKLDPKEARRKGYERSQTVWTLDFDTWEESIEAFGIERSIIPHREREEHDDGTGTWYN